MTFKITHSTDYLFDSEVFLEPHYLRFRLRDTAYLRVEEFSLIIKSEPAGHRVIQDEDNNLIDFCWFEGLTNHLSVKAESIVETMPYNPFNFILHPPSFNTLPFQYREQENKLLYSALEIQALPQAIIAFGNTIQNETQFQTIPYLTELTKRLHQDFKVEYREEGPPLEPDETFTLKKGSCRDLAWMLIHLLRQQGFAARFVSGYFYFDMDEHAFELHAWVEVYLPGAGWLGLDPSHGVFTGNFHLPIASSGFYENTMPVSGGIRGSATSKLNTHLSIEIL